MNTHAKFSGSTWEDPHGDPRIVEGATVLLGDHREIGDRDYEITTQMRAMLGRRGVVSRSTKIDHVGCRRVGVDGWYWRARDCVFIGEEKQAALERLADCCDDSSDCVFDEGSWLHERVEAMVPWLVRAGILEDMSSEDFRMWKTDIRRLAMALGRDAPSMTWVDGKPGGEPVVGPPKTCATPGCEQPRWDCSDLCADHLQLAFEGQLRAGREADAMREQEHRRPIPPSTPGSPARWARPGRGGGDDDSE